jgi:type I restriction enzyme S subunit
VRYPAYPEYIATRWAEVGSIPTGWEARRLKFSVSLRNEKIEAENNDLDYMGLEHIESWTGKRIEDETASSEGIATRFEKDDVLFGKLRPYLAKVYLAEKEGMATTEALVLMTEPALVPVFLKYLLLSDKFIDAVSGSTYGAKMPRANWEDIGSLPILLPSCDEQEQIAAFLDWKTGQIDALIAKKKELLEKLKEKRLAVITRAVTKGLPSTGSGQAAAPRRDSGVPWLGQVPEHWEVKRLKWAIMLQRGHDLPADERGDGNVPVVTSSGISALHDRAIAKAPGIVTGRYGTIGIFHLIETDYWPLNTTLYSNDLQGNSPRFLRALLENLSPLFLLNAVKSAVPGVDRNDLLSIPVAIPQIEEQNAIADHIDAETQKIDLMCGKVDSALARLTEYRTALITAATTGKIDVRDVAVPELEH